jgi:hypothetical protein
MRADPTTLANYNPTVKFTVRADLGISIQSNVTVQHASIPDSSIGAYHAVGPDSDVLTDLSACINHSSWMDLSNYLLLAVEKREAGQKRPMRVGNYKEGAGELVE